VSFRFSFFLLLVVLYAKNVGYDNALGDYINQLDSDDYLYTAEYEKIIDQLDGTDMVYMDLQIDNGDIWRVHEGTKHLWCGGTVRFIRKDFLGDSRCPEIRAGEDWFLNEELQKKPHTDKFTGIVGYHYTFPRDGSLCDLRNKGEL
jgi:glycosyltransferase involved in cell wall biosynthesis